MTRTARWELVRQAADVEPIDVAGDEACFGYDGAEGDDTTVMVLYRHDGEIILSALKS